MQNERVIATSLAYTLDLWVPSFRCTEAHVTQSTIPRLTDAQRGPEAWQSAQVSGHQLLSTHCGAQLEWPARIYARGR